MNFEVNLIPVLISAIVFMIVGTLWYGPLFGKKWMQLTNRSVESMKGTSKGAMAASMIFVFIAALVTSYVIAVVLKSLLITTVVPALAAAFWLWLGFIAATLLNRVLFEKSPVALYILNALQSLVAIVLGALVITLWPW